MRCPPIYDGCPSRFAALLLLFASSAAATVRAAEVAPYEARIVTPGAPVHSGPGEDFYPTDTLAQGDVVDVYREAPGGWLGIRPPEGSFSWLFGRHVKLLDDGLAEIDKDDVPSRIGSRLGERRNAVQVRLKKGEVVEVVSQETVDGETWYKIAPPSGEFRWIHTRHVARHAALATAEPAELIESAAAPIVTVPVTGDDAAHADANVTLVADAQPAADQDADPHWRASPVAPAAASAADTAAPAKAEPAGSEPQPNSPQPTANQPIAAAASPPPVVRGSPDPALQPSPISVDDVARQLTELELRLSRIVAEPPMSWQIGPLRQEAGQLLAAAKTDAERAAVNTTIAKLDRFADIAGRYQQGARAGSGDPRTTSADRLGSPLPAPSSSRTDTRHPIPDTSRYDAVGILRPVVSARPGAPQFALVDERGQVAAFVTPTPDLNLQPYLGHRIGITGSRGYIPEFQRAHVTAGRVAPLGERMIR